MRTHLKYLMLAFCFASRASAFSCDVSYEGIQRSEHLILASANRPHSSDAAWLRSIRPPFLCLLKAQRTGQGFAKTLANNSLRFMFGQNPPKELTQEGRYAKIAALLYRITAHADDPLHGSLLSGMSRGEWTMFDLFCAGSDRSGCTTMLPDDKDIHADPPMLGAVSLMHLERAYFALSGKDREQVAERIKTLYRTIPQTASLERKVIERIYSELFAPASTPIPKALS